ncbi:negative elongation factor D-like [Mercenaria mercenaria]|uniref:negative elongation factor D-like n=1 Tax=Mercenaria mercenaria TaxID=6596 RepID=UPI001E1D326B|nr:negative elongation factor D-like [Mercenaria mercenaria]
MADYDDDDDGMWNATGEDGLADGSPEHDDEEMGDDAVQQECLETFGTKDFIMEPGVFSMLKMFLQAGGSPERVVELLSDNYHGVAQTVNLLAEWMIQVGVDINEVQEMVESHLKEVIVRTFDPKKADSIFSDEGETPGWLAEMIEFPTWRELFYRLAEEYPDCLMLNFTIKLISDAGFQGEITSVSTACHQIEVFSRVLRTSISSFLEGGVEVMEKNLPEFTKMVCHGEHTYLYSQVMMTILAQEQKGGSNIRRICQELQKCANDRGLDVTPITLALSGAAAYPRACQALSSMLSKKALNPADITILYKMYSDNQYPPPPVDLIRVPAFLDLLIESLFKMNTRLNQEHKSKYIYLLSYAASVTEAYKKGVRKHIEKKELKPTTQALEKVQALCALNKNASELLVDVSTLFQCIKFPVIAIGVLAWVDEILSDKSYFKLNTDHTPLHLVLVDEIVTNHLLLHQKALDLLIRLFESNFDELDVLVQLELKKTVLDRMVHVFSCGCVIPVVNYIRGCHNKQDTDISLIRHFVSEVLDVIAPPYTQDFVNLFLPLIENEGITGTLRSEDGNDPVSEFICHCKANYSAT